MRILLSAYACSPCEGSEPGVGWGWARSLAEAGHEVWLLTRANNQAAIAAELARTPLPGLTPVYHDLPPWVARLKRATGEAGTRLYYPLWQAGAARLAARLAAERPFDLVHHATLAKYWSLVPLSRLGPPLLWGPVGGGERCPACFWLGFGLRGMMFECARAAARRLAECDPRLRRTAATAALAVAATAETAVRLRRLGAGDVAVASQVALSVDEIERLGTLERPPPLPPLRLICLGPLLPYKGLHLALDALAGVDGDWRLDMIGDGWWRQALERRARRLGLADRVRFHGAVPRAQALARLAEAHLMLFPALHDSGGMACAEALAAGVPVVCLDGGGPAALVAPGCGIVVAATSPGAVVAGLRRAVTVLQDDPARLAAMGVVARRHAATFAWPDRAREVYSRLPAEAAGQRLIRMPRQC